MARHARPTSEKIGIIAAVIGIAASVMLAGSGLANAASGSVFTVMNTSEEPPDGVYFRDSWNGSAIRVYGFGVFRGEQIQASCYKVGTAVGKYQNTIWYNASNISRPKVGDRVNAGWLNTHYVDDGQTANHANPNVPACNADGTPPGSTSTPTVKPTTIFFSPKDADPSGRLAGSSEGPATVTRAFSNWAASSCDTSKAISGLQTSVKTLAGFSLGRLGPIYVLARVNDAQRQQITHITMIDPGQYSELKGSCDSQFISVAPGIKKHPGGLLAEWLLLNPNARLTILAGKVTATSAHRGIQEYYFNDIRRIAPGANSRVTVCNYDSMGHWPMFNAMRDQKLLGNALASCPVLAGTKASVAWHPIG